MRVKSIIAWKIRFAHISSMTLLHRQEPNPYLHQPMGCPSWNNRLSFRQMEVGTEPLPTLKKWGFYNFGNISLEKGSPFLCSPPKLFRNKMISFLKSSWKNLESGPFFLFTYSLLKHCFLLRPYGTSVCPPRALVIWNRRKVGCVHMQSPYVSHLNMSELDGVQ